MATTQPIRCPHQVANFLAYYQSKGEIRNHLLLNLGVYTALRISDILRLSTNDVYHFHNGTATVRKVLHITEQKTKKSKTLALNNQLINVLQDYLPEVKPNTPLMLNYRTGKAISRIQAYRLIQAAATAVGIAEKVSCHSLRKTFGYHAWKMGVSPAILLEIYNHSSLAITRKYLGVTQCEIDAVHLEMCFEYKPIRNHMTYTKHTSSFM